MLDKPVLLSLARHPGRSRQRGAALLMAMVIVTLVSTLAASMVWQQWRAVQVESAERVRSQSAWVLSGALDWARLILREDGKNEQVDHLGEVWAMPLAEARLSTFLAADGNNNSAADSDDSPEAFLSGKVEDAHAKYNLRHLVEGVAVNDDQVKVFKRLLEFLSLPPSLADGIAASMAKAALAEASYVSNDPAVLEKLGGETGRAQAPLMPQSFDQLLWLGLDAGTLEKLRPYVTLLPTAGTLVNINTAPKEVIAAVVDGLDLARAARLVQARQRKPFKALPGDLIDVLGQSQPQWNTSRLDFKSEYFEVKGRLRYEDNVIEQRHLVQRQSGGSDVLVLQQSRFSGLDRGAEGATPP
ncbi:MAG: type II secretion system minor pseudopilin GspK [Aquabacterium sp.]|uniref:type II secretion system minor pseudopilin GspK n=1 Tax=Aquabacterium sp. TaxID=1872578 RepID=UPI0025C09625|nr:type II secretion system minor pseudopilin GspK [Aquabacterium sp.]MBI3382158.1 type II secretion system minor pseudopilin GspK [Aquabacterium sp.]